MSPLRSSPSSHTYIPSNPGSSCSSDKEDHSSQATTSTATIHSTKKNALSIEQVYKLKSGTMSLKEFIDLYDSVPIKNRNKSFYKNSRIYIRELSKTKASFEEKKAMFLSLPKTLTTSIRFFKLIFEEESTLLFDIMYGKTDPKQLQTIIDKLLQFFPPKYLERQLCQYVHHRQTLLREDKCIVASCRKKLRLIGKEHTKTRPVQTSLKEGPSSLDNGQKQQKHKQKLHPAAKAILDSLDNGTINTKDIISSRKTLISLNVDRSIIKRSISRFRYHIQTSQKQDIPEVLQTLNESGKQTAKIRSIHIPISNQLRLLLDQAYSGVLQLENVQNLRDLLFREYHAERAYACLRRAKNALIKQNKDQEHLIQETFKKTFPPQTPKSSHYKTLQAKIKSGILDVYTFTSIYDAIPKSDKTGTLSRLCSNYIKNLSETTSESYEDKLKLLKALPISLQKSSSTLNAFFPKESYIISLFKSGSIQSHDLKTYCIQLLKITDLNHILHLISKYTAKIKNQSAEDKKNIFDCKAFLKKQEDIQPQLTTHKKEQPSYELSESLYEGQPTTYERHTPNLHPQAQLILQSLKDCSIKTNNIVGAREQLVSLNVDKWTIKRAFNRFKRKITLSHKPKKKEILIEIHKSGIKSRLIKNTIRHHSKRLSELLTCVSKGTILLKDIEELRKLLFNEYCRSRASSMLYNAKTTLIKNRPQDKLKIELAFKKARPIKFILTTAQQHLLEAIKDGNLPIEEFTCLYNDIPVKERTGNIRNTSTVYIKNIAKQQTFHEKVATIRKLPTQLQSAPSIIKLFFPKSHTTMSLIRNGTMPSNQLTQTCMTLSNIINMTHINKLIAKYVSNKQQISAQEKQHIAECRKTLLDIQRTRKDQSDNATYAIQYDDETHNNTPPIADNTHHKSLWYTSTKPVFHEKSVSSTHIPPTSLTVTDTYIIEPSIANTQESTFIRPISPQPSTSYSVENITTTVKPFSLEQMSTDELTCILQNIVDEDENSEDQIILQNYLLQLANDLQQESSISDQTTYKQEEEQQYSFQSCTHTQTIYTQDTYTHEPISDYELPHIHEDFSNIIDLTEGLINDNFDQLADTLESVTSVQEISPEIFFDFSNIDETHNL